MPAPSPSWIIALDPDLDYNLAGTFLICCENHEKGIWSMDRQSTHPDNVMCDTDER